MQDASVNPHFLRQLASLANQEEVSTSEDVYSSCGMKLIAKGATLSHDLYERIVAHKLKKPLEVCVSGSSPVTPKALADAATALMDSSPSLVRFMGSDCADSAVQSVVKRAKYSSQAGTLLKLHQSKIDRSVHHGMLVGLLAMGMHRRLSQSGAEGLDNLIVASIFHDIGELYLPPELFRDPEIPLSPEEWRQLRAHPVIAHAVLRKMEGVAPIVADLVLEHHERLDGSGYPMRKTRKDISPQSHMLAVAETLARFISDTPGMFAHAEIALKIFPGEFDPRIVDIVASCKAELDQARLLHSEIEGEAPSPVFSAEIGSPINPDLLLVLGALASGAAGFSDLAACLMSDPQPSASKLFADMQHVFERINRAISTAGIGQVDGGNILADLPAKEQAQIRLEFDAVIAEVRWRLLDLCRQLRLYSAELPAPWDVKFAALADAVDVAQAGRSQSAQPTQASGSS